MALNSGSILKGFNLSKIVGGINDTLNIVNKTIPIYKQVSPIVKNVKDVFNAGKSIKEVAKESTLKEQKAFVRPVINNKKTIGSQDRGKLNLDTLTFFQWKRIRLNFLRFWLFFLILLFFLSR